MARRPISTFSLSFLDCLCCGFGSVILVFMIITNRVTTESRVVVADLQAQALRLSAQTESLGEELASERATLSARTAEVQLKRQQLQTHSQQAAHLARLADEKRGVVSSEKRSIQQSLEEYRPPVESPESVSKRGKRELVTGLKLSGQRILIMIDASTSMLDRYISNILLLRNMPPERQRQSAKWQQAVATVDWLLASIPKGSRFQVYSFDVEARPLIDRTQGTWLDVSDAKQVAEVRTQLRKITPSGGTSLYAAASAVGKLQPPPDNLFLLVDGLPTQGGTGSQPQTVSGDQRLAYFRRAAKRLPRALPVNVILYPLEGDPEAAPAYWKLALGSGGALLSPSSDWP